MKVVYTLKADGINFCIITTLTTAASSKVLKFCNWQNPHNHALPCPPFSLEQNFSVYFVGRQGNKSHERQTDVGKCHVKHNGYRVDQKERILQCWLYLLSHVLTTELILELAGSVNTATKHYTTNLHSFLLPC